MHPDPSEGMAACGSPIVFPFIPVVVPDRPGVASHPTSYPAAGLLLAAQLHNDYVDDIRLRRLEWRAACRQNWVSGTNSFWTGPKLSEVGIFCHDDGVEKESSQHRNQQPLGSVYDVSPGDPRDKCSEYGSGIGKGFGNMSRNAVERRTCRTDRKSNEILRRQMTPARPDIGQNAAKYEVYDVSKYRENHIPNDYFQNLDGKITAHKVQNKSLSNGQNVTKCEVYDTIKTTQGSTKCKIHISGHFVDRRRATKISCGCNRSPRLRYHYDVAPYGANKSPSPSSENDCSNQSSVRQSVSSESKLGVGRLAASAKPTVFLQQAPSHTLKPRFVCPVRASQTVTNLKLKCKIIFKTNQFRNECVCGGGLCPLGNGALAAVRHFMQSCFDGCPIPGVAATLSACWDRSCPGSVNLKSFCGSQRPGGHPLTAILPSRFVPRIALDEECSKMNSHVLRTVGTGSVTNHSGSGKCKGYGQDCGLITPPLGGGDGTDREGIRKVNKFDMDTVERRERVCKTDAYIHAKSKNRNSEKSPKDYERTQKCAGKTIEKECEMLPKLGQLRPHVPGRGPGVHLTPKFLETFVSTIEAGEKSQKHIVWRQKCTGTTVEKSVKCYQSLASFGSMSPGGDQESM